MEINNKTPFRIILDNYQDPCFHVFGVLKALNHYPDIYTESYIDEDGLLLATSFALLCERYIFHTTKNTGNYTDDFETLHELLDIEMFVYWFCGELKTAKTTLINDLKTIFKTQELILNLFAAIFKMETDSESFVGNYEAAQDFYENYIS